MTLFRRHPTALSRLAIVVALLAGLLVFARQQPPAAPISHAQNAGFALRFYGSSSNDLDRVKIPLGALDGQGRLTASRPVNVGDDFTIEFWMRAAAADNPIQNCSLGWYSGHVIVDRDTFGNTDGDYGVAICNNRIVFGVNGGNDDRLLVGSSPVTNNQWRHVAVTRNATTGRMQIFIDGQLDAARDDGPTGSIAYPLNRSTQYPNSDPYLVFAAEKHDYPDSRYYAGLLDDIRISNTVRYTADFTRPNAPHPLDANTVALYRFDEGAGTIITDAAGNTSPGVLNPRSGGAGQHWVVDTPFTGDLPSPSPTTEPSPPPGCGSHAATGDRSAPPIVATPTLIAQLQQGEQAVELFLPFLAC